MSKYSFTSGKVFLKDGYQEKDHTTRIYTDIRDIIYCNIGYSMTKSVAWLYAYQAIPQFIQEVKKLWPDFYVATEEELTIFMSEFGDFHKKNYFLDYDEKKRRKPDANHRIFVGYTIGILRIIEEMDAYSDCYDYKAAIELRKDHHTTIYRSMCRLAREFCAEVKLDYPEDEEISREVDIVTEYEEKTLQVWNERMAKKIQAILGADPDDRVLKRGLPGNYWKVSVNCDTVKITDIRINNPNGYSRGDWEISGPLLLKEWTDRYGFKLEVERCTSDEEISREKRNLTSDIWSLLHYNNIYICNVKEFGHNGDEIFYVIEVKADGIVKKRTLKNNELFIQYMLDKIARCGMTGCFDGSFSPCSKIYKNVHYGNGPVNTVMMANRVFHCNVYEFGVNKEGDFYFDSIEESETKRYALENIDPKPLVKEMIMHLSSIEYYPKLYLVVQLDGRSVYRRIDM